MGKILVIAMIVVAIWIGATVVTEGADQAFGGLFAGKLGSSTPEATDTRSTPQRAGDAFDRAYRESEDRVDRALRETR